MVAGQAALCRPASDAELADPLGTLDPMGWLGGNVNAKRLLCLAAGGGRQSAIYATAGAEVTVVDISPAMLELDRQVAQRRGLSLRLLQASMDRLDMLADGSFDIVVHPVSTCYVPDVLPVFREVARVLRPGGVYVSQHKSPISLQASHSRDAMACYRIEHAYYRNDAIPGPSQPSAASKRLRERGAVEYLHRMEELIGGICRSSMVIEDFIEPMHVEETAPRDTFADRARFVAPYLRIKARRITSHASERGSIQEGPAAVGETAFASGRIILPS
ncbi:MAG TPA: class I SAM-dependent methyltransferase [Planctomycetaceae bacterium]|nr:class I SAM-dependent methyltransferase [Planctomycetaceae bacterium]